MASAAAPTGAPHRLPLPAVVAVLLLALLTTSAAATSADATATKGHADGGRHPADPHRLPRHAAPPPASAKAAAAAARDSATRLSALTAWRSEVNTTANNALVRATNSFLADSLGVVVQWVTSSLATSSRTDALEGLNVSTGRTMWRLPIACPGVGPMGTGPAFPSFVVRALSTKAVVGCSNTLLFVDIPTQALVAVALPDNTFPTALLGAFGATSQFAVVSPTNDYLLLNVKQKASPFVFGLLAFDLRRMHFVSTVLMTCTAATTQPAQVLYVPERQQAVLSCADQHVLAYSIAQDPLTPPFPTVWARQFGTDPTISLSIAAVVSTAGTGMTAGVAVAYGAATASAMTVAYLSYPNAPGAGNSTRAAWSTTLQCSAASLLDMAATATMLYVLTLQNVVALPVASLRGQIAWTAAVTSPTAPIILHPAFEAAMVGYVDEGTAYMLFAGNGSVAWEVISLFVETSFVYTVASVRPRTIPLDETVPSLGPATSCLWVYCPDAEVLGGISLATGQLLVTMDFTDFLVGNFGMATGRLFPTAGFNSPLYAEAGLVLFRGSAISCVSLSTGWRNNNLDYSAFLNGVFYASTDAETFTIDRTGSRQWTIAADAGSIDASPFVFGTRYLLQVISNVLVVVLDAYAGTSLATVQLPEQCYGNRSSPTPAIGGLAMNAAGTDGYFTASLNCLLHLDAAATLTAIPTALQLTGTPIVDDGNGGMVYVIAGGDLVAVRNGAVAWTFHNPGDIVIVLPSYLFTQAAGNARFVLAASSDAVFCLDGTTGNVLWAFAQAETSNLALFNNSVYVTSTSGVCSLLLDPAVPTQQRQQWCILSPATASEGFAAQFLAVSPIGVVVTATSNSFLGVDTNTGAVLWRLVDGSPTMPDGFSWSFSQCTSATMDPLRGFVAIGCAAVMVVLDVATGAVAFAWALPLSGAVSLSYYQNMFAISGSYIAVVPIPSWWMAHRAVAPAVTSPPLPQTVPPGFEPKTIAPQLPPSYTPAVASQPPAIVLFRTLAMLQTDVVLAASAVGTLRPDTVFTANEEFYDNATHTYFAASTLRTTKDFALLFTGAPNRMALCTEGSVDSFDVGTGMSNYTWVTVCNGALYGQVFGTGGADWTQTNYAVAAPFSGPKSVMAVPALVVACRNGDPLATINAFNAFTGSLVWTSPSPSIEAATTLSIFHPPIQVPFTPGIAVVTGVGGLEAYNLSESATGAARLLFSLNQTDLCSFASAAPLVAILKNDLQTHSQVFQTTTLYFACSGASGLFVYSLDVVTGVPSLLHTIHEQATYVLNLVLLPETLTLLALTPKFMYAIDIPQQAVAFEREAPAGLTYLAAVGATSTLVVATLTAGATASPILWALSAMTGAPVWEIASNVAAGEPASRRLATYEYVGQGAGADFVVVSTSFGTVAATTGAGQVLWAQFAATGNVCLPSGIVPTVAADFTVGSHVATGLLVLRSGTCITAEEAPAAVLLAPLVASGTALFGFTGASDRAGGYALSSLHTVFTVADDVSLLVNANQSGNIVWAQRITQSYTTLRTVTVSPDLVTVVPLVVLITGSAVELMHADHGRSLAYLEFADLCPARPTGASAAYSAIAVAGRFLLFADSVCLYRIDVVQKTLVAATLSTTSDLVSARPLLSSDEQVAVLYERPGSLYGVRVGTMALLWSSNFPRDFLGEDAYVYLLLPSSSNRTAQRATEYLQEQFVAVLAAGTRTLMAFSFGTGQLLWKETTALNALAYNNLLPIVTSDGALVAQFGASLTKLRLTVADTLDNKSRVAWSVPLVAGAAYDTLLEAPGTDLLILVWDTNIAALRISTGQTAWSVSPASLNDVDFVYVTFTAVLGSPLLFATGESMFAAFALATGALVYSATGAFGYDAAMIGPTSQYVGFTPTSDYSGPVTLVPLLSSPTLAPPVPFPASPPHEPTAPPAYHFTTPQPKAPLVDRTGLRDFPSAAAVWRVGDSASGGTTFGAFNTRDYRGRSVVVRLNSNASLASFLEVLNVTDGAVLHTRVLAAGAAAGCVPDWMAQLSDRYGAYTCPAVLQLVVFDTKDPAFAVTATINISAPPSAKPFPLQAAVGIATLPLLNLACFNVVENQVQYILSCVDYVAGTVAFTKMVCGSNLVQQDPFYSATTNLILVSCGATSAGAGGLTAAFRPDGTLAWQNAILKAFNSVPNVYTADFGLTAIPSSGVAMVSLQLFNLSSGQTVGVPLAVSTAAPAVLTTMVQLSLADATVLVTNGSVVQAIQLPQRQVLWAFDDTQALLQEDPSFTALAIGYSSGKDGYFALVQQVDDTNATIFTFDLQFGMMASPPYTYHGVASVGVAALGSTLLAFYGDGATVVINMLTLTPYFVSKGGDTPVMLPFAVGDATLETSVVVAFSSYEVLRLFIQHPALPLADANTVLAFFEAAPIDTANGFLSVSPNDATAYLYDSDSGDRVWAVSFVDESAPASGTYRFASFTPHFFWHAAPYVAILSLANRHFAVLELNQGLQLADAFLPMCNGYGWTAANEYEVFGTAQDDTSNVLYVTIGNPCLYGIRATTGAVFTVANPKGSAFTGSPLITPACVITTDYFGAIACFPRLTSPNAQPLPAAWTYITGYNFDHNNNQLAAYGDYLLASLGPNLVCLSLTQGGQLFWTFQLGASIKFVTFNGFVYAVSSQVVSKISMDPTLGAAQRIVWQIPHLALTGAAIDFQSFRPTPLVTSTGVFVFASQANLFGFNCSSTGYGELVFNVSLGTTIQLAQFTGPGAATDFVLGNIFVAAASRHSILDASTGQVLLLYGADAYDNTRPVQLSTASKAIAYTGSDKAMVTVLPMAYLQRQLAAVHSPATPEPTRPAPNATLPPGFTPQGRFAGLPTLPPGVTLPDYGCVLNVEALYSDLVTCVNDVIVIVYSQNPNWNSVDCDAAADALNACVMQWVGGSDASCLGATLYLNQVLSAVNGSAAFDFCQQPQRCSSPFNAQHVCDVVNTAARLAPGQTLYPAFTFPAPANALPDFTLPPEPATGTLAPPPTSTVAPSTVPSTARPSLAPGSTYTPTTMQPSTAVPPPTTTAQPSEIAGLYEYVCSVVPGAPVPPPNFASDMQTLLRLQTPPGIVTIVQPSSSSSVANPAAASNQFTFYFADMAQASTLCAQLNTQLDTSPGQVAQDLHLASIYREPFTPPPTPPPQGGGGPSSGSVAGIVIGVLAAIGVAVGAGWFVFRARRMSGSADSSYGGLTQADTVENGLQGSSGLLQTSSGGRRGNTRQSKAGEEMAPILSSGKEATRESSGGGGYTQL